MSTETVLSMLRARGITPNVKMYCSQLLTVLDYLKSGDAVAVLYQSMPVDEKEFVKIPIPGITCKIGILWKKGVFVQENLQQFIRFVKEYRE
jgi:DNA-binding transcriptional LysR family regulator